MQRLFVAVDLPDTVKIQLRSMFHGVQDAKWVASHQMHLTLRFIGEATKEQSELLKTGLASFKAAPFVVTLEGTGQFPAKGKARVLWVGIQPSDALNQLQVQIEKVVSNCGFTKADHAFSPHITLARFRTSPPIEQLKHYLTLHRAFRSEVITVDGFILYASQLSASGSTYQQIERFPLR